jgi:hypothetical protein
MKQLKSMDDRKQSHDSRKNSRKKHILQMDRDVISAFCRLSDSSVCQQVFPAVPL